MSPVVQSAIVSGVIGIMLWYLSNRANRRAIAAANIISTRQVDTEDKKVDLSVLQASITDLTGRLGRVENDLDHERSQRKLSNAYARTLAQVLRDNDIPVPEQPAELDLP